MGVDYFDIACFQAKTLKIIILAKIKLNIIVWLTEVLGARPISKTPLFDYGE